MKSGHREIEEEKRRYDQELETIERKVTSQMEKSDLSMSKYREEDQKSGYDLIDQQLDLELQESTLMSKMERRKEFQNNMQQLNEKKRRKWLVNRGKKNLLDFQDEQIKKLKECFNSLDGDGSGSIGIEELEDPLIGLGFAENRDEVQEMIDLVDEDGSGMIEFTEFLDIIKNSDGSEKTAKINKFFKDMTSGQLRQNDLSFNLLVQKLRREYLMDAIMANDPNKKAFGEKILKNVSKQVAAQKQSQKNRGTGLTKGDSTKGSNK